MNLARSIPFQQEFTSHFNLVRMIAIVIMGLDRTVIIMVKVKLVATTSWVLVLRFHHPILLLYSLSAP